MAFIQRGRTPGGQFSKGVQWNGAAVLESVTEKSVTAVEAATNAAAAHARANHPWANRTYDLESSIKANPAEIHGTEVIGTWQADFPAMFLELGTVNMDPFPFLRPAADATYGRTVAHVLTSGGS